MITIRNLPAHPSTKQECITKDKDAICKESTFPRSVFPTVKKNENYLSFLRFLPKVRVLSAYKSGALRTAEERV